MCLKNRFLVATFLDSIIEGAKLKTNNCWKVHSFHSVVLRCILSPLTLIIGIMSIGIRLCIFVFSAVN
ncbi:hypothetical protein A359_00990 [secondary endosymbiont of Ctenarytaina eucalypti]|uniref:Uncharacterized protein n=1 Tax=secondary endosymbiont of Ctenarytaina eucalypti TaxID=1199245 RepID=J3YR67_9ENTR|nr:hypothetical protein A359_00990 [secondary endosymbiont of Ctenarytaina eucalypti]